MWEALLQENHRQFCDRRGLASRVAAEARRTLRHLFGGMIEDHVSSTGQSEGFWLPVLVLLPAMSHQRDSAKITGPLTCWTVGFGAEGRGLPHCEPEKENV